MPYSLPLQGPAIVTHIDLQAKTVTVKHGGYTLKTHAVSTLKIPNKQEIQSMNEKSDIDAISNDQQMTEDSIEQSAQERGLENLNQNEVVQSNQHMENKIDIGNMKNGQCFQGTEKSTGKKVSGKIISSAGKKKGSNRNCYNVEKWKAFKIYS